MKTAIKHNKDKNVHNNENKYIPNKNESLYYHNKSGSFKRKVDNYF